RAVRAALSARFTRFGTSRAGRRRGRAPRHCRGQPIQELSMLVAIGILIGLILGGIGAAVAVGVLGKSRLGAAEQQRKLLIEDAHREADTLRREAQISAREEAVRLRAEIDQAVADHRARILKVEERALSKEEEIDRKLTELARREQGLFDRETHLKQLQEEHKDARERQLAELERISGMTVNEAK